MRTRRRPEHAAEEAAEETPLEHLTGLLENQRSRWRRWFAGLAILLLAVGLNQIRINHATGEAKDAAAKAQTAANEAKQANRLLIAQRTEARFNTCQKDQRFAEAHDDLVLYFVALGEKDPSTNPALIADFKTKNLVPVPDCTPAGIAAFYAGQNSGTTPTTAAAPKPSTTTTSKPGRRSIPTTTRPTSTTARPSTTTTIYPSSPTTVATPCTGITLDGGLPCL